jgi:hypothetical protein
MEVKVGPLVVDPEASTWLLETWIHVKGIHSKLRQPDIIKEVLSMVGRVVEVEELPSLRDNPIHASPV